MNKTLLSTATAAFLAFGMSAQPRLMSAVWTMPANSSFGGNYGDPRTTSRYSRAQLERLQAAMEQAFGG